MRCLLVENYHQFPSALDFGSLPQFFARFRAQQTQIIYKVRRARIKSGVIVVGVVAVVGGFLGVRFFIFFFFFSTMHGMDRCFL